MTGVHGLYDFQPKPKGRRIRYVPEFTSSTTGDHYLSPDDYATIYDLTPSYSAGYDGTGQKIVIAVRCIIDHSDVEQFRTAFGLPVNGPQLVLVPGSQDPGSGNTQDCDEAYLDVEWLGAVNVPASVPEVTAVGGTEFNEARRQLLGGHEFFHLRFGAGIGPRGGSGKLAASGGSCVAKHPRSAKRRYAQCRS